MASRVYDGPASHAGQVTPSNDQGTPTPTDTRSIPQHGLSSSLSIHTGHQPKRLLSPAPIGLPTSPADPTQRASPVPGYLTGLTGQNDASNLQEDAAPTTPKRPALLSRGLSLQLPQSDSSGNVIKSDIRTPLTPKLDQAISYATPASLLPRRSRGMDFSRAATSLHHSTLAEPNDPESSPIVGNRGMSVPRRNGNSAYDSPMRGGNNGSGMDQGAISSSVGSINMLDSGSDSSSDDDIAMRDEDDTIHMTPQAGRNLAGISTNATLQSPGGEALFPFTMGSSNFQNYREKLRSRGSGKRKDSSSNNKRNSNGWRYDLFGSPVYGSPPLARSIESSENYFQRELSRRSIANRRESLSLGTDDVMKSDDTTVIKIETDKHNVDALGITPDANAEDRRNVIRKAVTTRRSHLIPKTKGFARIRAALAEEGAPIDVENRREAEVIRQVKQREEHSPEDTLKPVPSQTTTSASSPSLAAANASNDDSPPDDMSITNEAEPASTRRSSSSFSQQALRNGAGPDFWNRFRDDDRMRTPPPPLFPRESSSQSLMSEDASMGLETASINTTTAPPLWPGRSNSQHGHRTSSPSRQRSSTPTTVLQNEWSKKALGKRRREDDLDTEFFKRRAVSPGLSSIAGSPILPPSPAQRDNAWLTAGRNAMEGSSSSASRRELPGGHVAGERVGSGSSESGKTTTAAANNNATTSTGTPIRGLERRVGMQGMNEAGEGLMNMSIE